MTTLPWLHLLLKFFFVNVLNIAACGLHMLSMDGKADPVLNIIVATKFVSLPPIKFALDKISIGFPENSLCQLQLLLAWYYQPLKI